MENPHAPRSDPHRDISHFLRSREQDHALGLYTAEEIAAADGGRLGAVSEAGEIEATAEVLQTAPTASAEDSTSSTTSSTLLLRCQVKNFLKSVWSCSTSLESSDLLSQSVKGMAGLLGSVMPSQKLPLSKGEC